jgi:hypothetical protein
MIRTGPRVSANFERKEPWNVESPMIAGLLHRAARERSILALANDPHGGWEFLRLFRALHNAMSPEDTVGPTRVI